MKTVICSHDSRDRSFALQSLLALALTVQAATADQGMAEDRLAVLTDTLDQYVAKGQLAGGVLGISRRGEIALDYAFGWQDIERELPMTSASIHRIASQTKAFTNVGIVTSTVGGYEQGTVTSPRLRYQQTDSD